MRAESWVSIQVLRVVVRYVGDEWMGSGRLVGRAGSQGGTCGHGFGGKSNFGS